MEELYQLYKELEKLALEEKELIAEDEYQSLESVLAQKNEIIKKIDEIDKDKYKAEHDRISELLENLSSLEAEKISSLKAKKEKVKNKILKLYNREKSIKGYRKEEKFEAKFFDEKS